MLKYQKLINKNILDTNILMFITEEEEEENLYLNNLGLDLDEWISLFNTKENNLDKKDFSKKSQNLSTTFLVKKVIKKKEVYPLKQNNSPIKEKKKCFYF